MGVEENLVEGVVEDVVEDDNTINMHQIIANWTWRLVRGLYTRLLTHVFIFHDTVKIR